MVYENLKIVNEDFYQKMQLFFLDQKFHLLENVLLQFLLDQSQFDDLQLSVCLNNLCN